MQHMALPIKIRKKHFEVVLKEKQVDLWNMLKSSQTHTKSLQGPPRCHCRQLAPLFATESP